MEMTRRELLGAGAALALTPLPAFAQTDPLPALTDQLLALYPENATSLGIDRGARAGLKSKLTDRSPAGQEAIARSVKTMMAEAKRGPASIDNAVLQASLELADEGFQFPYGDCAVLNSQWSYRNSPYVVAQNVGAFVEIPSLLDSSHTIENADDAEAYLARMQAYAGQIDGETERLKHDAGIGVIAPDFLLDKTLTQLNIARGGKPEEWGIVTSIARRTEKMPGTFGERAAQIAATKIAQALDRQYTEIESHRARAVHDAGVAHLPHGDAYYAWALRTATTTRLSPEEVHQMGLEQIADLQSQMNVILKKIGYTRGSVGARMTALGKDPKYLFPNDDEGRKQIIAYLQERIDDMRGRMPQAFHTLVPGNAEVRRMAPEVEPGAPGAYGGPGTIDGTVPGRLWINLRTTGIWPRYGLADLAYHEAIPGHVWQGEYTFKQALIRSLLGFNAYSEGWALYAEQLADELGVYDADPVGRLGYLQSLGFRACRLVVDTGLHAKGWSREKAIEWFSTTNGSSVEEVQGEVDRYCAWPGQACGYKVGHTAIVRLREKARTALGVRFDFKGFNDAVITGGNVPMTVLERIVDSYVAGRRA